MRVSFNWFTAAAMGLILALPAAVEAQILRRGCRSCESCNSGCPTCQPAVGPDGEPLPSGLSPEAQEAMAANEQSNIGDFGASSGPSSSTPGMLGDSYIVGAAVRYTTGGSTYSAIIPYGGRYKCADNTGPVPTDRVSFAYKHFHNALQSNIDDGNAIVFANGNVDSYTLGWEKTFFDGAGSLELRVPFYGGSVAQVDSTGGANSLMTAPTFGNLSFIFKTLLSRTDTYAVGAGLGIDVPTADDTTGLALNLQRVFYKSGQTYIAPFISFLAVPNEDWWTQGVVQFSFVAGQNTFISPTGSGGGGGTTPSVGTFHEQDMVFVTWNAGKWIYKNPQSSFMPGVAAIGELNWTATLDHTQVTNASVTNLNVFVSNFANAQNIFNLTTGMHFQLSDVSNLRVSAVTPLTPGNRFDNISRNRYFDSEISVQYNRYF